MQRMFGMMPREEVKIEKMFQTGLGLYVRIQAGPNGWGILFADHSSEGQDISGTSEENLQRALDRLHSYFSDMTECEIDYGDELEEAPEEAPEEEELKCFICNDLADMGVVENPFLKKMAEQGVRVFGEVPKVSSDPFCSKCLKEVNYISEDLGWLIGREPFQFGPVKTPEGMRSAKPDELIGDITNMV